MIIIKKYQKNLYKVNLLFTFLLGISLTWGVTQLQLPRLQKVKMAQLETENYEKIIEAEKVNLTFLENLPTLGFDNLIASWTMLGFLQYLGDGDARKQTGYSLSYKYLEVIAEKDPYFTQAYLIISPASSVFGGTPQKTVAIMDKGLKHLSPNIPQAYFVWLYKGVDEILFIGDLEKAKKSYEKAAEWATIAGDERIAQSARNTAKFLSTNPDPRQAQVGAWFTVWTSSKDKSVRNLAELEIKKLGGTLTVYPDGRVPCATSENK